MNLQESIRRILREEVNSVDVRTIESELTNMLGPSKIKNGNRVEFVRIGSFNSSFDIVVDRLDQKTLNYINKFMSEKGWFPTNISLSGMKGRIYSDNVNDYIGEDDVQIGYESNFAKEVNTTQTKAFHVTPDIFIDRIKKTGLTLKSESKLSNHPDRIYLFLNQDKSVPKNMVWTIWNSLSKERQKNIKDYYVLEIDLTKLPNHKFYHDPQSMITYEAIYTNQPIPRSSIKVIDKISTSDIETKDDEVVMSKDEERRARDEKKRKEEEGLKKQKEFDSNLSKQMQTSKEFDELPDDVKYMSIDDLQEHIRKVLIETVNESLFFRRRVDMRLMEKEFFETLNFATDMFFKRRYAGIDFTFKDFKERVIDYLMDGYHSELSDGGLNDFPYDEVYEFLSDHFHDKIKDRYNSLFI